MNVKAGDQKQTFQVCFLYAFLKRKNQKIVYYILSFYLYMFIEQRNFLIISVPLGRTITFKMRTITFKMLNYYI